jgi:hypothetical protein
MICQSDPAGSAGIGNDKCGLRIRASRFPWAVVMVRIGLLAWHLGLCTVQARLEIIPTDGRNVYRMTSARTDGANGRWLIAGSTYDNCVCAFTADGKHLWDAGVGGFVFDLAADDVDGGSSC